MNHGKRLSRLEKNDHRRPRDIRLNVQYVDVVDTGDGRKEVALAADYDGVDWDSARTLPSGDRIAVRFPRSENPDNKLGKPR